MLLVIVRKYLFPMLLLSPLYEASITCLVCLLSITEPDQVVGHLIIGVLCGVIQLHVF